jgi:RecB family exonuclease
MIDEIDNEEIKGIEKVAAVEEDFYAEALPRGYLSVSQVAQFIKCGEAYRFRYILEEPIAPTGFQAQGRSVHKAVEHLHLSIIGKDPMTREEMEQIYSDTHDKEMTSDIKLDEEETSGQIKDVGISLVRKYHQFAFGGSIDDMSGKVIPAVQPIAAERVVKVKLQPEHSDPIPFMAVIDLEEETAIADLKTKKKAASQLEADNSLQLSLYAHITGKPDVRLDQLIKPTKTYGPRYSRVESVRTKRETLHALDVVAETAADIAAGRFRKTNPESWWCSEKWCPYWGKCRGRAR